MGQQQLLLLVLATVIVGLATVAGIQAFDEGQTQATQDALVQRAVNIGNDIWAAHNEPSQFGGMDLNSNPSKSDILTAAGYGEFTGGSTSIPADGAGDNAGCTISTSGSDPTTVTVTCADDGSGGSASDSGASTNQSVTVTVDPSASNQVQTSTINTTST